ASTSHRVILAAAPYNQKHIKFHITTNTEKKKNSAIDCKRCHVPAIWNHAQGENRHIGYQDRGEEMDDLVGPRRDDVFLDQHFDTIGDWLKKTERSHTIWAVSVLHPRKNFSFQH